MNDFKHNSEENYIEIIQRLVKCIVVLLVIIVVLLVFLATSVPSPKKETLIKKSETVPEASLEKPKADVWHAPDTSLIRNEKNAGQISYGLELIANTALYLGRNINYQFR
jgi:hypothetical protein